MKNMKGIVEKNYVREKKNSSSNLLRMFFRTLEQKIKNDPSYVKDVIKKSRLKLKPSKFI